MKRKFKRLKTFDEVAKESDYMEVIALGIVTVVAVGIIVVIYIYN